MPETLCSVTVRKHIQSRRRSQNRQCRIPPGMAQFPHSDCGGEELLCVHLELNGGEELLCEELLLWRRSLLEAKCRQCRVPPVVGQSPHSAATVHSGDAPSRRHRAGAGGEMPPVQDPACRGAEPAQRSGGPFRGCSQRATQSRRWRRNAASAGSLLSWARARTPQRRPVPGMLPAGDTEPAPEAKYRQAKYRRSVPGIAGIRFKNIF